MPNSSLVVDLPTFGYSPSEEQRASLIADIQVRFAAEIALAVRKGEPFLCLGLDSRDPLSDLCRWLERTVFDADAGGYTEDVMQSEWSSYEDQCFFFLAYDIEGQDVAGSVRIITGTVGFGPVVKTVHDCLHMDAYAHFSTRANTIDLTDRNVSFHPETGVVGSHRNSGSTRLDRSFIESYHGMKPGEIIFDMATLVVRQPYRGEKSALHVAQLLYAGTWRAALRLGAHHGLAFVRVDLLSVWRDLLGMPWDDLAALGCSQYFETDPYLSQPVYINYTDLQRLVSRALHTQQAGLPSKLSKPELNFVGLMGAPESDHLFVLW